MNIKIHTVISDLPGKTGTAIVEAIIKGQKVPEHYQVEKNDGCIEDALVQVEKTGS